MQQKDLASWHGRDLYGPPRSVPLSVRLRLLFGGFINQFGWFFFGFGMVFIWVFGGSNALYNRVFFRGELGIDEGCITAITETNLAINDSRVFAYEYTYSVNGVDYKGATRAFGGRYQEDDAVSIEYPVQDPARSRIRGLSTETNAPWWVFLIIAVFPLCGLLCIAYGIRKGLKGARLLRDGKQAMGILISREATHTKVNNQTVYKFAFQFETEDRQTYEAVAKTHNTRLFTGENVQTSEATGETVEADVREPLLYDPWSPSDAVLLDDLPGSPRINETGGIEGSVSLLLVCLIIPGCAVIGHACWVLYMLELL